MGTRLSTWDAVHQIELAEQTQKKLIKASTAASILVFRVESTIFLSSLGGLDNSKFGFSTTKYREEKHRKADNPDAQYSVIFGSIIEQTENAVRGGLGVVGMERHSALLLSKISQDAEGEKQRLREDLKKQIAEFQAAEKERKEGKTAGGGKREERGEEPREEGGGEAGAAPVRGASGAVAGGPGGKKTSPLDRMRAIKKATSAFATKK